MDDDLRQQARDRFDRVMRVPDRLLVAVGFISLGIFGLLVMETMDHPTRNKDFLVFYVLASAGVGAFGALYLAFRSVAAFMVAATAVRRRDQPSRRHAADRPADRPGAQAQTVHQLAAGR
jgi:hypothetical protein